MRALLLACTLAAAQDGKKKPQASETDKAIDKGVAFLKKRLADPRADDLPGRPPPPPMRPPNAPPPEPPPVPPPPAASPRRQYSELVLWTLLHAGVPESDAAAQKLLKSCVEDPLWQTYNVALLCMILQKLDGARFQKMLASCGQFFADTQCENGQWGYGHGYKPIGSVDRRLPPARKKKDSQAPPAVRIARGRPPPGMDLPPEGDNSNSQYAALAIRACREAGVEFPAESIKLARASWEKSQNGDGSWSYVRRGPGGRPDRGYASMTCGGIGALAIYRNLAGEALKSPALDKAREWLGQNFSVKDNSGHPSSGPGAAMWYYYYLYSLERAGDLLGAEKFAEHDWYAEGSRELLRLQRDDGSWKEPSPEQEVWATCFAILFLRRATHPLIETGK
jgi:hypothetical protein